MASIWDFWPARLAAQAWAAAKLPGDVYQGKVDPSSDEAIQRAADLAGLVTGGSFMAPAQKNAVGMGIKAYHGSPHDFDKFDLSKIGTGEGAQSYGHGLYFAENPNTAKSYRDSLTDLRDRFIENTDLHLPSWVAKSLESGRNPQELLADFRGRLAQVTEESKTAHDPWNYPSKIEGLQNVVNAIEAHMQGAKIAPAGRMYEVNINAKPEQFLDYDNGGRKIYEDMARKFQNGPDWAPLSNYGQHAASVELASQGVPGIKYLDQGSRNLPPLSPVIGGSEGLTITAKPNATYNYVVFNPEIIDILRKYGLIGAPAAGALAPPQQQAPIFE